MTDPINTDAIREACRTETLHHYDEYGITERLCDEVDSLRERNLIYARDLAALRAELSEAEPPLTEAEISAGVEAVLNERDKALGEVDRLRAEHALIRGDNATLGATVTELRAVADAVLEDAFGTDDDPNCIVDGRLLARLRDALAAAQEADR